MDIFLIPALKVIFMLLDFYMVIVVASVIFDWLRIFNVINNYNRFVAMIGSFLYSATAPVYRQIRKILPPVGNFDFAPLVIILGIYFIQEVIIRVMLRIG